VNRGVAPAPAPLRSVPAHPNSDEGSGARPWLNRSNDVQIWVIPEGREYVSRYRVTQYSVVIARLNIISASSFIGLIYWAKQLPNPKDEEDVASGLQCARMATHSPSRLGRLPIAIVRFNRAKQEIM
jgi:hypothetical protein